MMIQLNSEKKKIYLPIEHHERELDAKILFSLFAAKHGYETVLGYKQALRQRHSELPQGAWILHNARGRGTSLEYFWYKRLGFGLFVLDEEALVRQTDNLFLRKHVPSVFKNVEKVFAWGESDRDFWLRSNIVPAAKLTITGNPRVDLMRPELLKYHEQKVTEIKNKIGKYVLINTNFPTVNNAMGEFHKFNISDTRNRATTEEEITGFLSHKRDVFDRFVELIPSLAAAIQPHTLVVRPHPSEDRTVWEELAKNIANVEVILDGGVVPWIMGSEILIHNNCTTAVEAALLKKPVASFMPLTSDKFDNEFCNAMGTKCSDEKRLVSFVNRILDGEKFEDISRQKILSQHVKNDDNKFSCEYMLEEIGTFIENGIVSKKVGKFELIIINLIVDTIKYFRKKNAGQEKINLRSAYLKRKASLINKNEITMRMNKFKNCLDNFHDVECVNIGDDLFLIRK